MSHDRNRTWPRTSVERSPQTVPLQRPARSTSWSETTLMSRFGENYCFAIIWRVNRRNLILVGIALGAGGANP